MSNQNRSTYQGQLNTPGYFEDNTSEQISEGDLRGSLTNLSDSVVFKKDDAYLRVEDVTTGTEPDYVVTLTNEYPGAYNARIPIMFKAHDTNTGAATLNVNSLGAKDIRRPDGSATEAGDIVDGQLYIVNYVSGDDEFLIVPGFGGGVSIPGGGGLTGSTGSTDNALLRADGTGGSTLQNSSLIVSDLTSGTVQLKMISSDGSDDDRLMIAPFDLSGTPTDGSRGAWIGMHGNEYATFGGHLWLVAGDGATDPIRFYAGGLLQGTITSEGYSGVVNNITVTQGTITSAQILASNTTPISLIAAPGAGEYIVIHQVVASIDYNSTTYAAPAVSGIRYSGSGININLTNVVEATADTFYSDSPQTTAATNINEAIQFYSTGGDPTTGNSDIKYKIWYSVETI